MLTYSRHMGHSNDHFNARMHLRSPLIYGLSAIILARFLPIALISVTRKNLFTIFSDRWCLTTHAHTHAACVRYRPCTQMREGEEDSTRISHTQAKKGRKKVKPSILSLCTYTCTLHSSSNYFLCRVAKPDDVFFFHTF